ncbi:MAG: hypothetical protein ACI88H_003959 [Cocleimonas sp.]|jgi:hypothetical protein
MCFSQLLNINSSLVKFELGFELSYYPLYIDKSWHNDVCPSFMFKAKIDSEISGLEDSS